MASNILGDIQSKNSPETQNSSINPSPIQFFPEEKLQQETQSPLQNQVMANTANDTYQFQTQSQPQQQVNLSQETFPAYQNAVPEKPKKPWKKITMACLVSLLIICASTYGFSSLNNYDKYAQKIPVLSLLPSDPEMVLSANIDPNSAQYAKLEEHLQKFPGYALLEKEIDPVGKGKTLSEALQDKLSQYNLDFKNDLTPALGENAYIAIPDLTPLGTELQKNTLMTLSKDISYGKTLLSQANSSAITDQGFVLGDSTTKIENDPGQSSLEPYDSNTESSPSQKNSLPQNPFTFPKLDFVAGSEIKDLRKAQEVFTKIEKDSKYKSQKSNYAGFDYYEISIIPQGNSDKPLYEKLYATIIGKNLLITSRIDDLKKAIDSANNTRKLGMFSRTAKSVTLSENTDFAKSTENYNGESKLLSIFLKMNFSKFFKCQSDNCTNASSDMIKYPENTVLGLNISVNNDGIEMNSLTNSTNLSDVSNSPFTEGLAKRFPEQINGSWANIFVEHENLKDLYYSFKKNNLNEKGLKAWNDALSEMESFIQINLEKDFIDQIDGKSGLTIYTDNQAEPKIVAAMRVKDTEKMYATLKKITDLIKLADAQSLEAQIKNASEPKKATQSSHKASDVTELKKKLTDVLATNIIETATDKGKIYSFKMPDNPFISFDFSLENNELIISSHYEAVLSLLALAKNPSASQALEKNQLFSRSWQYTQKEGCTESFIATQGLVDVASYAIKLAINQTQERMSNIDYSSKCKDFYTTNKERDDCIALSKNRTTQQTQQVNPYENELFAVGSILRTIKFFSTSQSIQGSNIQSTFMADIKELPKDEKDRAEKILNEMNIQK